MMCIYVGPAEYQIADQRKQPGGVIMSEKPRFKEPKVTTPGPGAYKVRKYVGPL